MVDKKVCTTHFKWFPDEPQERFASEFSPDRRYKNALRSECRRCSRLLSAKYREQGTARQQYTYVEGEDKEQLHILLPVSLKDKLRELAQDRNMSMSLAGARAIEHYIEVMSEL